MTKLTLSIFHLSIIFEIAGSWPLTNGSRNAAQSNRGSFASFIFRSNASTAARQIELTNDPGTPVCPISIKYLYKDAIPGTTSEIVTCLSA